MLVVNERVGNLLPLLALGALPVEIVDNGVALCRLLRSY